MAENAALTEEIRERRTAADADWGPIVDEARKDRLCAAGKVWEALDPKGLNQREDARRPHLGLDELNQYLNQTVNGVRANPRGIKFAPTGNGASDEGAELYANHTREIEYRSHATRVGYPNAFDHAVTSSYGWTRIRTKRQHIRTFDQDLWIEPVHNPDQVLPGPFVWPDARDLTYLFFIEPWPLNDIKRKFGVDIKGLAREFKSQATQWIHDETADLAEYWKIETFERKLVAFRPRGARAGEEQTALVDELPGGKLPDGADNLREETVEDSKVCAYLTDGLHILKEIKWVGKYIPFVSCLGKVLYVEDKGGARREILSMTRLARDPFMLYCYIRTCQAELVGTTPKFPYFVYKGQLDKTQMERLIKSVYEPVAVIEVTPTVDGVAPNTILPPPTRNPYTAEAVMGLDVVAEAARRAIQSAMGISPLPTAAQRRGEKSGVALEKIDTAQQRGAFHYVDHYDLMIERNGILLEDLYSVVLDTARDLPVRLPNDNATTARINDPRDPKSISTNGTYRVTISTGPSNDSQREAADDFVDQMVSNLPTIEQVAGPPAARKVLAKSIKIKQLGPEMDELIDVIDPPPQNGPDGEPMSPEMQAMAQENQQLKGVAAQMKQVIDSKQIEAQAKAAADYKTEEMKQDKQTAREVLLLEKKLAADIEKARITAAKQVADLNAEAREEAIALGQQQAHEAIEAAKDRVHDVNLAQIDHAQTMEQADQQHGNALEAGAQAAALQPPPMEGADA